MTLTGRRRPLFDIVGAAQTGQIMTCSSLSDNFTIFQSTTTWHHHVSIQVANKSIYNFVGPIETAGWSPTLNGLSRGMWEFFCIQLQTNFCRLAFWLLWEHNCLIKHESNTDNDPLSWLNVYFFGAGILALTHLCLPMYADEINHWNQKFMSLDIICT